MCSCANTWLYERRRDSFAVDWGWFGSLAALNACHRGSSLIPYDFAFCAAKTQSFVFFFRN
jgi:hypothetical protein